MVDIKTGDILLVGGHSWLSRQISRFTNSEWTHAGVFCYIWGELYIIEALSKGIQITKWSDPIYNSGDHKTKGLMVMKYLGKKQYTEKEMATFMLPYCGTRRYDYPGLFEQAYFQITGRWIGRTKDKATKRFYCSEFVSFVHNHFLDNIGNWWEMSPAQLSRVVFYDKIRICN